MKYLTDNEWKFIKETKFTPTVFQCNEYHKTTFANLCDKEDEQRNFNVAQAIAKSYYDVDLKELIDKASDGDDGISLEFAAPYILYNLYTRDELVAMSNKQALEALRDFKYFCGWRKADEMDGRIALYEAIKMHDGEVAFTDEFDGDVWFTVEEKYEDDCAWDEE